MPEPVRKEVERRGKVPVACPPEQPAASEVTCPNCHNQVPAYRTGEGYGCPNCGCTFTF